MVSFSQIESVTDRLTEYIRSLQQERDRLRTELNDLRTKLSEKDLERIRESKERERISEALEREKMAFQKERTQLESQVKAVCEKLGALLPQQSNAAETKKP
jgi:transcription elongation factor